MAKQFNETECPKCKKYMRADALKCPYCLSEFTAADALERKRKNKMDNRNGLYGCLFLVTIAILVLLTFYKCSGDDKPANREERQQATAELKPNAPLSRNDLEGVVAKAKQIYASEAVSCESAYLAQLNDDTVKAVNDGYEEIKKWGKYDFSRLAKPDAIKAAIISCQTAKAAFEALPFTGVEKIDPARTECSARYGYMSSLLGRFEELVANKGSDDTYPMLIDTWNYDEGSYENLKKEWNAGCRLAIIALPTR